MKDAWDKYNLKTKQIRGYKSNYRRLIFERDNYTCKDCGYVEYKRGKYLLLTVDHKFPKSQGGTEVPSNLQTLCFDCNCKKGTTYYTNKKEDKRVALEI